MTRTDEFALIETLFAPLATDAAALGLKDDAALWSAAGEGVIAKDMLVEGVHFRSADPLDRVARKALRVNLSDLAAMGATPAGYLLGLALPDRLLDRDALGPFADGLAEDQAAYGLSLIGGDTTRTPGPLVVSITMTGRLDGRRPLRRGGALVGDDVYVSGTIGDAGLGLRAFEGAPDGLAREHVACLKDRYQLPEPRLGLGEALCGVASAAADVSDGLLSDAGHIASASGVRIELEAAAVPLSVAAAAWVAAAPDARRANCATLGDDYELVFTAPPGAAGRVEDAARKAGVGVSRIGTVVEGEGAVLLDASGRPVAVKRAGWNHGA